MNDNASTLRLAASAVIAFAAILGAIVSLALSPVPTGGQLQATATVFGVAIAIALASVVGEPRRSASGR